MSSVQYNLTALLDKIDINLSNEQLSQLHDFIRVLLDANQVVNLTSITDFNEALIKHIYDSLVIMTLPEFQSARTIIDIGSGGGIPSIPLAVCNPEKAITSLEATQKKLNFQIEAGQRLNLTNFYPIWGRAETIAGQTAHREQYDLVIARALASLNILAELTLPFVKIEGRAIFYKGKEVDGELAKGTKAIQTMGAEFTRVKSFTLPNDYGSRVLILLQKKFTTPSIYPRKPGVPQKKPL